MLSAIRRLSLALGLGLALASFVSVHAQDVTAILRDTVGAPGSSVVVQFDLDNQSPQGVQGFSFSFWSPTDELTPEEVLLGPAMAALNGGSGPDFLSVDFHYESGGTGISCGTVFSFMATDELDPGELHHALDMVWTIDATVPDGTVVPCQFCDCLGTPPLASIVVIDGDSIVPNLVDGGVTVVSTPPFVRGDANSSGAVDVADPIYALNYLFQGGDAICQDAMDANADQALDLADVLYLLSYINGAGAPPPAPFSACGVVASGLGCDAFPSCD